MNKKNIVIYSISLCFVTIFIALIIFNLSKKPENVGKVFGQNTQQKADSSSSNNDIKNSSESKSEPKSPNKIVEGEAKKLLEISAEDIVFGNKNAPLTIIEYASLSCPHCAHFYSDGFSKMNEEYIKTDKVNFVYRDFPLNQQALVAGTLALCQVQNVKSQDRSEKYYNFIKILFKTQDSWAFVEDFILKLETIAKLDGISSEKFQSCIKNKKIQESILKSRLNSAQNLQFQSTPTFFIGDETINGYGGYGEIKSVIERKLSEINKKNS